LARTKDPAALPAVREALRDTDAEVRRAATQALCTCGGPATVPDLLELLHDSESNVRHEAAVSLRDLCAVKPVPEAMEPHIPHLINALIEAMRDEYDQVRQFACLALEELRDARAVPGLVKALRGQTANSAQIARSLAALGEAALPELREALHDLNERVRIQAISLIANQRKEPDAFLLAGLIEDGSPAVRELVVRVLSRYGEAPGILQVVIERLQDPDEEVRLAAITALGEIGQPAAVPYLIKCLDVPELADAASGALERMDTRESRAALRAWKRRQIE
jgi:HEAT repeat protein